MVDRTRIRKRIVLDFDGAGAPLQGSCEVYLDGDRIAFRGFHSDPFGDPGSHFSAAMLALDTLTAEQQTLF